MIPFYQSYYNNQHPLQFYQNPFNQNWYYPFSYEIPLTSQILHYHEKVSNVQYNENNVSKQQQHLLNSQSSTLKEKNSTINNPIQGIKEESNFKNYEVVSPTGNNKTKVDGLKDIRNSNSNLLRMFFRRLEIQMKQDPDYIKGVIRKNKMRLKFSKLAEWLEINKIQHRNYIRLPCVKKLFLAPRKNQETTKVMRILLGDFIKNQALCYYLTSKKIKRESMGNSLNSIRSIFSVLLDSTAQE